MRDYSKNNKSSGIVHYAVSVKLQKNQRNDKHLNVELVLCTSPDAREASFNLAEVTCPECLVANDSLDGEALKKAQDLLGGAKFEYTYEEFSSGGAAHDPNDQWSGHDDVVIDFSVTGVKPAGSEKQTAYWNDVQYVGLGPFPDRLWGVVIRYSDGSTFGRTIGHGKLEVLVANEWEARRIASRVSDKDQSNEWTGMEYIYWDDYFGGLDGTEVHCFSIE